MSARHKGEKPDTRPARRRSYGIQVRGHTVGDCKCGGRMLNNGKCANGDVATWCPRCGTHSSFKVKRDEEVKE